MNYLVGDHWQGGVPWMGPGYTPEGTLPDATKSRIRRQFVAVPECESRVRERVNAACGNQADIDLQPAEPAAKDDEGKPVASKEQLTYAEEWKRDIGAWWDRVNFWGGTDIHHPSGVRGMVAYGSAHPGGKACLRAFFNPASRTEDAADGTRRIPKQAGRQSALRHIEIVAPSPERCVVYTDPDTLQKTGVFLYSDENNQQYAEIWYARQKAGDQMETVRRLISDGASQDAEAAFPWGGILPIQEAEIGCLLTKPVLSLQSAIDFHATALNRLTEAHGFGARTEINSAVTGTWRQTPPAGIEFPETKVKDGVTWYLWPDTPELGNGVIRRLVGFEHTTGLDATEEKESIGLTTPQVHYHEPSNPQSIITSLDAFTMLLRDACHQGHITTGLLGGSTAEASGDAYEQKRASFGADAKGVGESVDGAVAPILTCVTVMADWLAGDDNPTFAEEWTVKVQSHPSAGPVSSAKEQGTAALVDAELISPEEGTARVGVQDVQAERQRIAAGNSLALIERRAKAAKELRDGGADAVASYIIVGFSEQDARMLARTDGEPFVNQ